MDTKFIFVTGGVVSGLGKGITAASLGRLLKARGLKVTVMKLDPYLNVDPGTMNPMQHGEVFVTDDGAETDLDLGHYERFIDESLSQNSNLTSGRVFFQVISDERKGIYGGQTIQVIPHITNEIKRRIALNTEADVVFVEIGGTVGDIEGQPFLEAIRQFAQEHGRENCMFIHVTLIPYLSASMELKTKPTQHSVKELLGLGIRPDVIVCRCEHPIDSHIREKIALFCNVPKKHVIENRDMPTLYEIPLALEKEGLAEIAIRQLHLKCSAPDLTDWVAMVERNRHLGRAVDIALVGKYVELHDSYLSVAEALKHGGIENDAQVRIHWLDSERITPENVEETFQGIDGMLDQKDVSDLGGTMRLGQYPCVLQEDSKAYAAYGRQLIFERHRHRYEVNNDYRDRLEKGGMRLCGVSPDKHIVEMIELVDHPWFLASQAHPEFKSRPNKPHPLFSGFIGAALGHRNMEK